MYLNQSATLHKTLYVCKDLSLGQTFCNRDNDPNLIKTEIYIGQASYGSKKGYQPTIWVKMNGVLQKQFSGKNINKFWTELFPKLQEKSVAIIS